MTTESEPGAPTCTVVAPSILKALRLVREQLGPDAFILSSIATSEGVEIVASLEEPVVSVTAAAVAQAFPAAPPAAAAQLLPVPVQPASAPLPAMAQPLVPLAAAPEAAGQGAAGEHSVLREIHSMRGMIEEQLSGLAWNEAQRRDPLRAQLLRTLLGAGFSARLAKEVLAGLSAGQTHASGLEFIKSSLARQMPVLEDEDALMDEGGVYALMGPTGVGKTTTTAKLAARCVMRFGPDKLALITTDSYRIGAYEQLCIYGQILGVPVHAVKDADDLELVLASLHDKHMVLIDTVGMSQRDRAVSEQVFMLRGASRPVKRLLLLNASSHGDTLNEVVQAYRHGGDASGADLAGCILTKVDESTHPGVLVDIVIRHQLRVHYVSSGQKVPENLMRGDRAQLIDSVFEAKSQSSLFVPGEADVDEQPAALRHEAKVAAAEAVSQRLRAQCRQLISTLAHNAQELITNAVALAAGDIGFDPTRALWRMLADARAGDGDAAEMALAQACADSRRDCTDYVLASTREAGLPDADGAGAASAGLPVTALLSDRTGLPFAARLPAAGQALHQFDNKPVVHLFAGMASPERIQAWQAAGIRWVASAPASLHVELVQNGQSATLQELVDGLLFSPPQPVSFRGREAQLSVAEMLVSLSPEAGAAHAGELPDAPMHRCVVRRIVDASDGALLAHSYLLASIHLQAKARKVVQWAAWRVHVEPYFGLLDQALAQLAGSAAPEANAQAGLGKTAVIAAQACTTVFRLQQASAGWAETARSVLAGLAEPAAASAGPALPGAVLFEGLGKLYALLDALELDEADAPSEAQAATAKR